MKNKYVLSIFVFALFVRLIFVAFFPQLEVESDAVQYDTLARSLASGRGFSENGEPSHGRGPVYPFFLSIIYRIFGHSYLAVRIAQSFLGAIVCWLIYLIGKRTYNSTIGLIAMGLSSVYPVFIAYSGLLMTETLYMLLLCLTVLFLVLGEQTKQIKYWILSGASLGLSALCRSEGPGLPLTILICWLILAIPKRELLYRFAALTLTIMFLVLPWTYRNYRQFNAFIPVSIGGPTGIGASLWQMSYPYDEVQRAKWLPEQEPLKSLIGGKSAVEADEILLRDAIKNIREHPTAYLKYLSRGMFFFWISSNSEGFYGLNPSFVATLQNKEYSIFFWKLSLLLYKFLYICLGVLGLGSIVRAREWRTPKIYLVAVIGYICAVTVVFSSNPPRHGVPIMPFVIVLAAVGISSIQRWIKSCQRIRVAD